jgi:hypothetical protein
MLRPRAGRNGNELGLLLLELSFRGDYGSECTRTHRSESRSRVRPRCRDLRGSRGVPTRSRDALPSAFQLR